MDRHSVFTASCRRTSCAYIPGTSHVKCKSELTNYYYFNTADGESHLERAFFALVNGDSEMRRGVPGGMEAVRACVAQDVFVAICADPGGAKPGGGGSKARKSEQSQLSFF